MSWEQALITEFGGGVGGLGGVPTPLTMGLESTLRSYSIYARTRIKVTNLL